jgi:probable addiction module antidote protein
MPLKTFPFDGSRYISSEEAELDFIKDALETGDEHHLAHVLGLIARARGLTSIAKEIGVSREVLYDALSERDGAAADLRRLADAFATRLRSASSAESEHTAAE